MNFLSLKRYALFVTFICYFPHIITEPLWLFLFFLAAIVYRLIADYFSYPLIPRWIRFTLVLACLFLLYEVVHSHEFIIQFLLVFIILKCMEFQTVRDLKVLILCNFFLIFSALIVVQEFWILFYLLIAIFANLSLMLKLNAPDVSLRQISGKSVKQLLIAIPLGLLLFYIFPRIDPFWHVPPLSNAVTGFNEKMSLGTIADLFNDDSTVMNITFKGVPNLNGYWRGLVLSFYTGSSWISSQKNDLSFLPLKELQTNETADYEILLEPNQTKWLFYEGYPSAGSPPLLFSPDHGLIRQNKEAISQRFDYSITMRPAPYSVLTPTHYAEATQLPWNSNPRLTVWAKEQFEKNQKNVQLFITFLHNYIHQQPFWYTLKPPILISDTNQMDSFWFDTQKGFCEHYASAVTFILRAAGIPARVVVGYHGGEWNPISHVIIIRQNNAHAWLEYWQEGMGWQQLDPTSFIATDRIDPTIRNQQLESLYLEKYFSFLKFPLQYKINFYLESIRFYTERWFLFYNQNTQKNLLQNIGLGEWDKGQLLQISIVCMVLCFILLGFYYQWSQRKILDKLLFEYHLLQKEFQRFNISIHPSTTLEQQCKSLINKSPDLNSILTSFMCRYEQLRLKQPKNDTKENKKETIALFKALRYRLRRAAH